MAGSNRRAVYSCVVDSDPRFHLDALRWFAALTEVAGVPAEDLAINMVGDSASDAIAYLERRGVHMQMIEAFDSRSPHCNKIGGALALASRGVADRLVVLTDTDVAIARDPGGLRIPETAVGAKIVDAPNPPLDVLESVFATAGLELPSIVDPDLDRSSPTIAGNVNGGLYLVPGGLLPDLSRAWARWAHWLLDRSILGSYDFFTDQVAMAMAIADEAIGVFLLERQWNFPTHVPGWVSPATEAPAVVHYHQRVEPTGLISATQSPAVDEVITRLNVAIADLWHDAFPNRTFWQWRYENDPSL